MRILILGQKHEDVKQMVLLGSIIFHLFTFALFFLLLKLKESAVSWKVFKVVALSQTMLLSLFALVLKSAVH